jgi:protein involved in polysaccharide export with SLBB domain
MNVVKYAQRKFTIMGQVARPGSYELQGGERIDILEAIGLAGGFTRVADRGRVVIQRKENGSVSAIRANTKRMADGKEMPVEVQPGDVITVTESWF